MKPVPLSVIGGYLGAGKTTLINGLLAGDHGIRCTVLVNDFGAINIDAGLLESANRDTIELSNGCVCCSIAGDLFYAIGDILDRPDRPDHMLVEASGIADPAKIAAVAYAEKELSYGGVLTVVDALNFPTQIADHRISPQLLAQVRCADNVAVSKSKSTTLGIAPALEKAGVNRWLDADDISAISKTIFKPVYNGELEILPKFDHPHYVSWSSPSETAISKGELESLIARVPREVFRLKAILPDTSGGYLEAHVVGTEKTVTKRTDASTLGAVAIGLEKDLDVRRLDEWWSFEE